MSLSIGVGQATPRPVRAYADISNVTASWRAIGGAWQLTATLTGDALAIHVPAWLGADLHHDSWDWFGKIVTLDLTVGRAKRRWDLLEKYANRVVTVITDTLVGTWQEDTEAVARYGKWELVLENGGISGVQADDWSERTLAKRKDTIPFGIGINAEVAPYHVVELTAIGLLPLTARIKNNYVAATEFVGIDFSGLADQKISTIITELVDNWSDGLLSAQAIRENATTVDQEELQGKNTWALLEELTAWDTEADYRIDCDKYGNVTYFPVTSTAAAPDYSIYANHIRARGGGARVDAGHVRPGWFQDTASGVAIYGHEVRATEGSIMPEITVPDLDVEVFLDENLIPEEGIYNGG